MNLFFVILIILIILISILFFTVIKIFLTVNSDEEELKVRLLWLYPFLKIEIEVHNYVPMLIIDVFNKSIIRKEIKNQKRKAPKINYIKQLKLKDVNIETFYGFKDPSTTGITCGLINAISNFINISSLSNRPDFVADNDYIYINATAKLSVGMALVNLFKSKRY